MEMLPQPSYLVNRRRSTIARRFAGVTNRWRVLLGLSFLELDLALRELNLAPLFASATALSRTQDLLALGSACGGRRLSRA
jgi:hypothetical protein